MTTNDEVTDEAIERVRVNANPVWTKTVMALIEDLATVDIEFTTDVLWKCMEIQHEDITTHEPRAMGGVMRTAKAAGLCRPTGRYIKTTRREAHGRPVAVWHTIKQSQKTGN